MKAKLFYGFIILILLVACSSGDERRLAVERLGYEIAYQNATDDGVNDFFLAVKDKTVYHIEVSGEGTVGQILMVIKLDSCDVIAVPVNKGNLPVIDSSKY